MHLRSPAKTPSLFYLTTYQSGVCEINIQLDKVKYNHTSPRTKAKKEINSDETTINLSQRLNFPVVWNIQIGEVIYFVQCIYFNLTDWILHLS